MKITNSNYKYVSNLKYPKQTVITFTEGQFAGVEFFIDKISINEDKEKDECSITFNFEVVSENHQHLEKDKSFGNQIGDLVVHFLESHDKMIGSNDKNNP
jgi:hypothetical protein